VTLGLDSAQFSRGAKEATSRADQLRTRLAALGGALAGAGVGAGLTKLASTAMNTGREITRLSQVANAAPVEFQRWSAATSSVGIEQEKLADILKDVNDRVGDFVQTGGGPLKDFMENIAPKVGVTADQFQRLSGPEALQLYVSSLEKAGVSQQDMTFYMEALASDATLLLPLLRNNGEQMGVLGDRAQQLGRIIDGDTVASLARARAAVAEVGTVLSGLALRVGAEFAPGIASMSRAFVGMMEAGQPLRAVLDGLISNIGRLTTYAATAAGLFAGQYVAALVAARLAAFSLVGAITALRGAIMRTGFGLLIVGAGELVYQFSRLVTGAGGFGNAMSLLKDVAVEAWQRMGLAASAVTNAVQAVADDVYAAWLGMLGRLRGAWADFLRSLVGGAQAMGMDELALGFNNAAIAAQSVVYELEGLAENYRGAAEQGRQHAAALANAATGPLASVEALKAAVAGTKDEFNNTASAAAGMGQAITDAVDGAGDGKGGGGGAKKALKDLKKKTEETEDAFAGLGDAGREAFVGLITKSKDLNGAIGDLLASLSQMFANAAWQTLSGGFSGGGGGGGGFFSGIRSILGFANGTNSAPGGLAMVGERGRELVNLPRGSRVFDAQTTKSILSGDGGGGALDVHVTCGFDESGNLYVTRVAKREAASAAAAVDRNIRPRIQQFQRAPQRQW
jgi:methyl-accepting chemotaxis protein